VLLICGILTDVNDLLSDVSIVNTSVGKLFCDFLSKKQFMQFEDIIKNVHESWSIIKLLYFLNKNIEPFLEVASLKNIWRADYFVFTSLLMISINLMIK